MDHFCISLTNRIRLCILDMGVDMKLGIRVFQAKFGRNLGLKVSVGGGWEGWDCTKFWVGITGLKNLIRDPPSRHMPREMIACNKAFPFFGEEQQATGKIAY